MRRAKRSKNGAHVDVALELDRAVLGFADGWHFGRFHEWKSIEDLAGRSETRCGRAFREFAASSLVEMLTKSRRPLKEFPLDHSHVAGTGNICSCESMWRVR